MAQAQTVQSLLGNLGAGPEKTQFDNLKKLFWSELNYESSDQRIPTDQWTARQKTGIKEIKIFAHSESQFGKFDIIHCRLDKLSRSTEREVITTLLRQYPYALFVFNDDTLNNWHFVNVKYAKDSSARPMLRRITVGPREQLRTASERIAMLDLDDLTPDMFGFYPLTIQERHDQAFDVEAVTNAFYHQYETIFTSAEKQIRGVSGDTRRLFTQRLFNRLMFVRFVERKGWLSFGGSFDYLKALWKDYSKTKTREDTFYASRLSPLFFAGLNTPNDVNIVGINPRSVLQELIGNVPYLNGGLFEKAPDDYDTVIVPDEVIEPITDGQDGLFYRFNFTVTESTPFDIEVAVDPEMLGKIFEELVTGRHESGSYYTPKAIVSFMGREAIRNYLQVQCPNEQRDAIDAFIDDQKATQLSDPEAVLDALKRIKICDPACGSGAYLLGMMQELLELRRNLFAAHRLDAPEVFNRKLEIIQNNLYGVDVDPFAVQIARLRLWLSLIVDFEGEKPLPLPNLDYKVEQGNSLTAPDPSGGLQPDLFRKQQIDHYRDLKACYLNAHGSEKKALRDHIETQRKVIGQWLQGDRKLKNSADGFDWAVEFTEVFAEGNNQRDGFDVIVANPPYVRQELIGEQKPVLKAVYDGQFSGTADLYVYFYLRALQLLRTNGVLTFISSNKWLRAGYGKKLRETLGTYTCVQSLIDFGDLPVFGAIAYPCIIVIRKTQPPEKHRVKALNVNDLSVIDNLLYELGTNGWQQPQNSLDRNGWELMRPELFTLLEKIKRGGKPLGEYVNDTSHYGIKTGLSEAFMIDGATRARLIGQCPNSAGLIKPWLRGRDIKRWCTQWADLYVIAVQNSGDADACNPWGKAGTETKARAIFKKTYPAIHDYLSQFEEKLRNRQDQGRFWWELRACAYYAKFEKPKILYQTFQVKPVFTMDTRGFMVNNAVWMIALEDYFLLGYLNSSIGWHEISRYCTPLQRGYQLIWDYFKKVIVPQPATKLREQIASTGRQCSETTDQAKLSELEAKLNRLVYQAYGLTDAEIALIEDAVGNTMGTNDTIESESE